MAVLPIVTLPFVTKLLTGRVRKNADVCACISGFEGVGKSNFAMLLSYLCDKNFNLWDNVLYSPNEKELLEKLKTFKKGSILNLDEAVKVLEKQAWAKQTFIKKTFQVIRGKNLITLLLIPRLEDLNEYFRNWRVMLNICVIKRGLAYLQVPDVYNKDDVWHTKYNQTIMDSALAGETFQTADISQVMIAISKYKGFLGFVTFPKLPAEIEKEYIILKDKYSLLNLTEEENNSEEAKAEEKNKANDKVAKFKNLFINSYNILKEQGLSQNKIALKLGYSRQSLRLIIGQDA